MECERVREDFIEGLTGKLDRHRSKAVDAHIAGCAGCRAETDRMRELWTELGSLRVSPPTGAGTRFERLIRSRSRTPSTGVARTWRDRAPRIAISALALAASVFAGVMVGQRSATTTRADAARDRPVATPATPKERYVLLLHGPARRNPTTAAEAAADSATERALVAEYGAWAGRLAAQGSLVMAEKLADEPRALLAANGVTNVPSLTPDVLGGFFLIQVADSAEAYRIARECPHLRHGGTVQLRRIEPT